MAGLCNVLPKNIWLYVSQIPNLSAIGSRFLLQGGTQYNLAAVKAQVDFIESRFKGKEVKADVIVHEHCGEAGAIGAALEAGRLWDNGRKTTFIGLDACANIQIQDHARRSYALLLLQEQVPAHVHRCEDQCRQYRLQAAGEDQGSAGSGRAAPDPRHLRKGHGGKHRRYAPDQGQSGQGQEAESELRRTGRQGACSALGTFRWWPMRCPSSRSRPRRRSAPN